MVNLQGVAMGRPSRLHMRITEKDGAITRVQVGGKSVQVGDGADRSCYGANRDRDHEPSACRV